ncbi:probable serine/threonine-protein kinase CPE1738 [Hyalella azteca]|uniref:Probable serine/threonine-protein kinase CPE1738 n=1 Tax=Hyalella azteca TaxID=294128 RepID=A0A8B7NER2_HYAAZ|nr:probable serine/threonine-protein kinase CPE1738 [Hyalella azteca]
MSTMSCLQVLCSELEIPSSSLKLCNRLGSGSHGQTFVVQYNGQLYCAKIYKEILNMAQEVKMLKATESCSYSPNLIGICSSLMLVVMDLAPGQTLQSLLRSRPCKLYIHRVMLALCQAIESLHACQVIHNDLKFDNIMVSEDNWDPRITLIDFGFATFRHNSPYAHISPEVMASYRHVSPKLASGGKCDYNTDNYSFGVLLRAVSSDTKCPLFSVLADILTKKKGVMYSLVKLHAYMKENNCDSCRESCWCAQCISGGVMC